MVKLLSRVRYLCALKNKGSTRWTTTAPTNAGRLATFIKYKAERTEEQYLFETERWPNIWRRVDDRFWRLQDAETKRFGKTTSQDGGSSNLTWRRYRRKWKHRLEALERGVWDWKNCVVKRTSFPRLFVDRNNAPSPLWFCTVDQAGNYQRKTMMKARRGAQGRKENFGTVQEGYLILNCTFGTRLNLTADQKL